ncbi:hypothetical protein KIW84_012186 [Lathyrus oleraceus]|uniref:Uncharacterized protein n=1 Tax=Pisum sativum TaxID=3888 RepID=A0A9D5GVW2_PEA|nr:hypothetical protein KIW84_012186 [Pisum sativum]
MASKLKRKAGTAGKGKEKASSSSMDVQHFFKDHTPEELERISEGEYHVKRVESHGGEEPPKDFWSAGNFFINDRLLHYFLAYVILPRNSNHYTVTDMEMQALYAIKKDILLNWSRLILHHLMTHTNKFKSLPYAWFITRIMEYFNVDFSDVEYCLMDTRSHKISIKNVDKRMGYRYNPETKSVMFIGGNNEENEEIPQEGNGGEDIPPPSGLSNQYLFKFMTSQFANLNTSINDQWISANNQIALNHEATTNRINLLQTDMNQHFYYLYSHLNIPPYDPNNPAAPAPIFTPIQQQFPYQGNNYNNTNNDMNQP